MRAIWSYCMSMQFPFLNSIETRDSPRLALARPLSPATRRPWRTNFPPDSARRSLRPLVCIPLGSLSHPLSMHPLEQGWRQLFQVLRINAALFDLTQFCTPHNPRLGIELSDQNTRRIINSLQKWRFPSNCEG